jgi:hypothetical protein
VKCIRYRDVTLEDELVHLLGSNFWLNEISFPFELLHYEESTKGTLIGLATIMRFDMTNAVEAAMGMRFRLQLRQDNMATGKAEQRTQLANMNCLLHHQNIPAFFFCNIHFFFSIILLTLASFFKHRHCSLSALSS